MIHVIPYSIGRGRGGGSSRKRPEREPPTKTASATWAVGSNSLPTVKRHKKLPGEDAVSVTYATPERALAAVNEECAAYGVSFHVRRKNPVNRKGIVGCLFTCSCARSKAKCKAHLKGDYNVAGGTFCFDLTQCVLDHNGHDVGYVVPEGGLEKIAAVFEQVEDLPVAEDMRLAFTSPTLSESDIPVRLGGQRELDKMYVLLPRNGWLKYCSTSRVLKSYQTCEAQEFRELLSESDCRYFDWWLRQRPYSQTTFVRVSGANAMEMQLAVSLFQRDHGAMTYGVKYPNETAGADRYVIFHHPEGALMAVDSYSFRMYRLVSCMTRITPSYQMPVTPLLLQSWVLTPSDPRERALTRFGMRTTLEFMWDHISQFRVNPRDAGMIDIDNRGFSIYSWLPEFLGLFSKNEREVDAHIVSSTALLSKQDDTYYTWIMAFLSQKEVHYIHDFVVDDLIRRFNVNAPNGPALRKRYPHAFAILDHLFQVNGRDIHPLVLTSWESIKCPPPADNQLPHYYIYELCFENELLDRAMRVHIASGITIPMDYRDMNPESTTTATVPDIVIKERTSRHLVMYAEKQRLYQGSYPAAYAKPSEDAERLGLKPVYEDTSDLGAIQWLYYTLRAMDNFKRNKDLHPLYGDEYMPSNFGDVSGPLRLGDPVKFAMTPYNLPVAKTVTGRAVAGRELAAEMEPRDQVVYFEEVVWVCNVPELQFETEKERIMAEAIALVRDPRYYFELHQGRVPGEKVMLVAAGKE